MDVAELDRLLSLEYSDDYWSDEAVVYLRESVEQMSNAEFQGLRSVWRQRPQTWQRRLAEVLSRAPAEGAFILGEMLESSDEETAIAAAESLNSLEAFPSEIVSERARAWLLELAERSPLNKMTVDELMEKIEPR
jgi:hypothetical protein